MESYLTTHKPPVDFDTPNVSEAADALQRVGATEYMTTEQINKLCPSCDSSYLKLIEQAGTFANKGSQGIYSDQAKKAASNAFDLRVEDLEKHKITFISDKYGSKIKWSTTKARGYVRIFNVVKFTQVIADNPSNADLKKDLGAYQKTDTFKSHKAMMAASNNCLKAMGCKME